ncbi:transporter substrate-binding domain-containing protein [Magnetococcales bacterium HHB-1]
MTPASQPSEEKVWRVVTKPFTPFIFPEDATTTDPEERVVGFSADLWREIAAHLGIQHRWVYKDHVSEIIKGMEEKRFEVGISGITITAKREKTVDFSYPIYRSGLQIMVGKQPKAGAFLSGVWRFIRTGFLWHVVVILVALLLLIAHIFWLLERKTNPDIPTSYIRGVSESFWWAAVTGTSVGYGDTVPQGTSGRSFSIIWMFLGYFTLAYFTAGITAELTIQSMQGNISGIEDLHGRRVATVSGTSSATFLKKQGIKFEGVRHIREAYQLLHAQKIDALVYDAPTLSYYAAHEGRDRVRLVGSLLQHEYYGIVLPEGSPWREKINHMLLILQEDGSLQRIHDKWFHKR